MKCVRTKAAVKSHSLLLLLCSLSACDIGGGGKFVAPSARGMDLASHNGNLTIVPGNALSDDGRTMGPQQNLLYLLVVCPEMSASKHGTGTTFGRSVNTYSSFWETAKGKVSVPVDWNKVTDIVTIDRRKFRRETGNVFVIVRQPSGAITTRQLPSPSEEANEPRILRYIQQQLTNDALVASIRLPQRE